MKKALQVHEGTSKPELGVLAELNPAALLAKAANWSQIGEKQAYFSQIISMIKLYPESLKNRQILNAHYKIV